MTLRYARRVEERDRPRLLLLLKKADDHQDDRLPVEKAETAPSSDGRLACRAVKDELSSSASSFLFSFVNFTCNRRRLNFLILNLCNECQSNALIRRSLRNEKQLQLKLNN